jgi:hypothetical protein
MKVFIAKMYQVRVKGKIESHWHSRGGAIGHARHVGGVVRVVYIECPMIGERIYFPE